MGQAASVETLHMPVSLCLGRKRRRLGQRKERNREMVEQQTDRQTDKPRKRWEPSTDSLWGAGVGSTLYATRAGHFFPSPRGGDMCFSISNMSL